VAKECYDLAEDRLREQIPTIMSSLHQYAIDQQQSEKFKSMTGNWINSFGVALYRDGKLIALADMGGLEDDPIRTVLVDGETFDRGTLRFDERYQRITFVVGSKSDRMGSSSNYFANEEVVRWLQNSRTRSKGFTFRVVSVTEYQRDAAREVLLQMSDEVEQASGIISDLELS
jgi:hypothetical protein